MLIASLFRHVCFFFFFFQAEDGIRDKLVTGVQTCALPIYRRARRQGGGRRCGRVDVLRDGGRSRARDGRRPHGGCHEIGRASCRGRGEISVVAVSLKKKKKGKQGKREQVKTDKTTNRGDGR